MFARPQLKLIVILVSVTGLLFACGSDPELPVISNIEVDPGNTINAGEEATLRIDASGANLRFEWTVIKSTSSRSRLIRASSARIRCPR